MLTQCPREKRAKSVAQRERKRVWESNNDNGESQRAKLNSAALQQGVRVCVCSRESVGESMGECSCVRKSTRVCSCALVVQCFGSQCRSFNVAACRSAAHSVSRPRTVKTSLRISTIALSLYRTHTRCRCRRRLRRGPVRRLNAERRNTVHNRKHREYKTGNSPSKCEVRRKKKKVKQP